MYTELKRTWAEINLDHLAYNYKKIRERIGKNTKFLGVVKGDAYGHGKTRTSFIWIWTGSKAAWSETGDGAEDKYQHD